MATNLKRPVPDGVDRAAAGVRRAVGRLVPFLGDEDTAVVKRAAAALAEVGPYAVGPLAAALPLAASPRHRCAIMGAVYTFGRQAWGPVTRALVGARKNDPDEHVRAAAGAALSSLIASDAAPATAAAGSPR